MPSSGAGTPRAHGCANRCAMFSCCGRLLCQGFEAAAAKSHDLSAQYFVRSPGHCCSLWDVTDWRIILRDTDGDKLLCFWLCHVLTSWWWMPFNVIFFRITFLSPFSSFSRILGNPRVQVMWKLARAAYQVLIFSCVCVCALCAGSSAMWHKDAKSIKKHKTRIAPAITQQYVII
jgi:hypothetical protein